MPCDSARQANKMVEKNSFKLQFTKAPEGDWRKSYADSVLYGTDPRDEVDDDSQISELAPPPVVLEDYINWRNVNSVSCNKSSIFYGKQKSLNRVRFNIKKRNSLNDAIKTLTNSISDVKITVENCTHSTNELKISVNELNKKLNSLNIRKPGRKNRSVQFSPPMKETKTNDGKIQDEKSKGNKIILSSRKIISDKDICDFRLQVTEYLKITGIKQSSIDQINIKKFQNRKSAILTIDNEEDCKKIKQEILKKIRKNNKILKSKKEKLLENMKLLNALPFAHDNDKQILPATEEDANNNLVSVKFSSNQMVAREYYVKKNKRSEKIIPEKNDS